MKFVAAILVFCAAAVYAGLVAKDINALLERASDLEAQGNKIIAEFHNHSKSHLLSGLEHEVKSLEHIANRLRNLSAANETHRTHELNRIEEDLLHHENRLGEEMDFVLEVYHYNATGKSANELVNYGEGLIKEAKDEIAKHASHGHLEVIALQMEIHAIERTIKDLQAHDHGLRHDMAESALVRHELTLRALIKRMASAHH